MEENKKTPEKTVSNKAKWICFVVGAIVILTIIAVTYIVHYSKLQATNANSNLNKDKDEQIQENIIEQQNLVNTSKLSEEELKKLNEEEVKKAKEKEKKKNTNTTVVKNKYYIKVNYGAQVVTIYTYDKKGNYTVPVKACVCSTGAETPLSGVYRLSWKATWGKLFGNVWGHYCTQIVGDILFHSVPYMQAKNDTLVSAYYDRLGTKDSMGCIRLTTIDAKWIFDNCPSGTQVEFYSSSNPGPLGKPTAKKISNAPGNLKNWDPTDPASNNPWKKYKPETKPSPNPNTNNQTSSNIQTGNTQIGNNEVVGNNVVENNEIVNNEVTNSEIANNQVENNTIEENITNDNTINENKQNTNTENPENSNTQVENTRRKQ